MIKQIFAVKDIKAAAFVMDPIFAVTKGVAIRGFTDAVNNPELGFQKHPGDYQLWYVGEFDCLSGVIKPLKDGPECVGDASQFLDAR